MRRRAIDAPPSGFGFAGIVWRNRCGYGQQIPTNRRAFGRYKSYRGKIVFVPFGACSPNREASLLIIQEPRP